jgi:4-amino-4-deoxy-L-arabinose transferase-like glycosyltransferase
MRVGATAWGRIGLGAILALGAGLRLWQLDRNRFGTDYYSAGVRSMAENWHNFLFNAFDPAGFVSLDKPPVAFWLQVLSTKLFGFNGLAVLLPQVIEGVAAIALLYHLVARRCGRLAGLAAALFLALTPISVAVDRSSNTDSCLVLVLLLAAWALIVAAERGSWRLLILAMALVGLGFNVKMMAALVAVPGFALVYWLAAPAEWRRRFVHLAASGAVLLGVALSWAAVYDLTPVAERPYAGSSQGNSMLELTVGHNGIERLVRLFPKPDAAVRPDAPPPLKTYDDVPVGPLRLADRHLAGQVTWLWPLAAIGAVFALLALWRQPGRLTVALWAGWALSYAVVFSAAGGIFHAYYLVLLAPPLAALAGIGLVALWPRPRWLVAALVLTAAWQVYVADTGGWRLWLAAGIVAGVLVAALGQIRGPRLAALGFGLAALLAAPAIWAVSAIVAPGVVMLPSASADRLDGRADEEMRRRQVLTRRYAPDDPALAAFLTANRGDARYLLATPNARLAAPLIIATGAPVMAIGGFMGSDPILGLDEFAARVAAGEVRYVLVGAAGGFGPGAEGRRRAQAFRDWLDRHGEEVPPAAWRSQRTRGNALKLYAVRA